jgi:hypothetical protein
MKKSSPARLFTSYLRGKQSDMKGGTRKIADLPNDRICLHPEHNPATMKVWMPGLYEHTCPGCGQTQGFTIERPPTL